MTTDELSGMPLTLLAMLLSEFRRMWVVPVCYGRFGAAESTRGTAHGHLGGAGVAPQASGATSATC